MFYGSNINGIINVDIYIYLRELLGYGRKALTRSILPKRIRGMILPSPTQIKKKRKKKKKRTSHALLPY